MGRYGRGRHGWKDTTESYLKLDVRLMQRHGYLRPGAYSIWHWSRGGEPTGSIRARADLGCVILSYRHQSWGSDEWTQKEYPVGLDWTRCNYGGARAWFLCPGEGCGRRVATLWGAALFLCRHCRNLAYESQNETVWDRALRKHQAIRMKLGGSGSLAEDFPRKPKGIHWRTYYRLVTQAEEAQDRSWPPWIYNMVARAK